MRSILTALFFLLPFSPIAQSFTEVLVDPSVQTNSANYGAALIDIDNDGLLDIHTTSGNYQEDELYPALGGGAFGQNMINEPLTFEDFYT